MKKTKTLHRQLHPIHWHGSMLLALAAILVAASKSSSAMARSFVSATPVHSSIVSSLNLREAETTHEPAVTGMIKSAGYSGE